MSPFGGFTKDLYSLEFETDVYADCPTLRVIKSLNGIVQTMVINKVNQQRPNVKAQVTQCLESTLLNHIIIDFNRIGIANTSCILSTDR